MQPPVTIQKDLRSHIATVRHQKYLIFSAVVLVLGATIFLTMRQTPLYTSEGQLRVTPITDLASVANSASIDMPTERYTVTSVEVAAKVSEKLGGSPSAATLESGLSASVQPDTQIISVSYADPSAKQAQQITQTFMDVYLGQRRQMGEDRVELRRGPLEERALALQNEIQALTRKGAGDRTLTFPEQTRLGASTTELASIENVLRFLRVDPESGGQVTVPANLPTSPSSPDWSQNIVLAIMLGFAFGLGIAILRENLSEGLSGSKDLEAATGAAVLAAVPAVGGWRKRSDTRLMTVLEPKSNAAEAYRTLRTNLLYIATTDNASVFCVTSATLGEGKSTTTANLAAAIAQTGKRVIAVSCDLRKPRLHRFFDLTNDIGVTSILASKTTLAEAAQRPVGIETLRLLASGPVPSNPAELLGSPEFDQLLGELRLFADLVLIDTPPILAVSDSLIIGPKADGVILVADAHQTSKGAVEHTREQVEQVGGRIIGCVFNNFDPTQAKYYPYDKRYYYSGYYSAGYPDEIDPGIPQIPLDPRPEGTPEFVPNGEVTEESDTSRGEMWS